MWAIYSNKMDCSSMMKNQIRMNYSFKDKLNGCLTALVYLVRLW